MRRRARGCGRGAVGGSRCDVAFRYVQAAAGRRRDTDRLRSMCRAVGSRARAQEVFDGDATDGEVLGKPGLVTACYRGSGGVGTGPK
jgi:hypothetical protein